MCRRTVIKNSLQKRKRIKNSISLFLLILATLISDSVSDIANNSDFVTENNIELGPQSIVAKDLKESHRNSNSSDNKYSVSPLEKHDSSGDEEDSRGRNDQYEDIEDSQVEGDSSHDDAYTSIIANYYTADPFFGDTKKLGSARPVSKHKKLVASEKTKNGKLRHKIRVKSKKTASLEPLQMRVVEEQGGKVQMPMQEIKRKYKTTEKEPTKRPIVKSLPLRRNLQVVKQNEYPREQVHSRGMPSTTFSKAEENISSTYEKPSPRFSDENAFAPDDGWKNQEFHELMDKKDENKPPRIYRRNQNDVRPRPKDISRMPATKIKMLNTRTNAPGALKTTKNMQYAIDESRYKQPVATERQSFSELLPSEGEPDDNNLKNKKKQRPRIKLHRDFKKGKNSNRNRITNVNFKESDDFLGKDGGNMAFLSDIDGSTDPFAFLESDAFGGPVIAGMPGGPESHSFFDIMDDFFDEPRLPFPSPGDATQPTFTPNSFSNGFGGEQRDIEDPFSSRIPSDGFGNNGFGGPDHSFGHEATPFAPPLRPSIPESFDRRPSPPPSYYQNENLYVNTPTSHYHTSEKETETYTASFNGYMPNENIIPRPYQDDYDLKYKYQPDHVKEFEIRKLPPQDAYHSTHSTPHRPFVHELPRLPPHQDQISTPVYYAKPDYHPFKPHHPIQHPHKDQYHPHFDSHYPAGGYGLKESFKHQSPYAYNLVSSDHKTSDYDDHSGIKFGPPYKRQVASTARENGARLLDKPKSSMSSFNKDFSDIPKINMADTFELLDSPRLSPPAKFEIPEHLSRSLNEDLDLQSDLYGNPPSKRSYDLRSTDKTVGNDKRNTRVSNREILQDFPPEDEWLQRSIDTVDYSFENSFNNLNEPTHSDAINQNNLQQSNGYEDLNNYIESNYEDSDYDDYIPLPNLPPPPEMLKMTGGSSFLPIDVPKLGSRIPYRPPELAFDEFYKRTESLLTPDEGIEFNPKEIVGEMNTNRESKIFSFPTMPSSFRARDNIAVFGAHKMPFKETIDEIYPRKDVGNNVNFRSVSKDTGSKIDPTKRSPSNTKNRRVQIDSKEDFLPPSHVQRTIESFYSEGSEKEYNKKIKKVGLPPSSIPKYYKKRPLNHSISRSDAIEVTDPPKDLKQQGESNASKSSMKGLSFSKLIHQPSNEVEVPAYKRYDPLSFKILREKQLGLYNKNSRSARNEIRSELLNPNQFQSRSLNVQKLTPDDFSYESMSNSWPTDNLSWENNDFDNSKPDKTTWPVDKYSWENNNFDHSEPDITNRRSSKYGRSLDYGPIPPIAPPPPHLPPPIPVPPGKVAASHQFVHVLDLDKFKAGYGRGNEYHNIHDVQSRDGVHHKEAVR